MQLATTSALPLPAPTVDIAIRPATVDDIPAIDRLQKPHSRELGFFPRAQLQGYIEKHGVLVAEVVDGGGKLIVDSEKDVAPSPSTINYSPINYPRPIAYIAYTDRYLKRDELGIVVQLCVDPAMRRSFIGAALLKEAFERSSYGCRLFCCWCAQDLAANKFWESMGFSAIAFRTGSTTKGAKKGAKKSPRIHVFWQKRIRAGDVSTPFWFPSKTEGGAMGAQRLVLPIPPGMHWSDAMPVLLPTAGVPISDCPFPIAEEREARACADSERPPSNRRSALGNGKSPRRVATGPTVFEPPLKLGCMLRFAKARPVEREDVTESTPEAQPVRAKRAAKRSASADAGETPAGSRKRYDPMLIAKARELRDRWMEEVDRDPSLLMPTAKYDVARLIAPSASRELPLLGHQQAA